MNGFYMIYAVKNTVEYINENVGFMAIDWYKRGLIKYESLVSSGISIGNEINGNQLDDVQVDNVEIDFHFTKMIKTYS